MENLPADKLASFGPSERTDALYAKKHDPFVLFDDVKNNPARMAHVRDYTQLGADLNSRTAPQFVWITPNQCHDMHGGVYDTVPATPRLAVPLRRHEGRRERRGAQAEGRRLRARCRHHDHELAGVDPALGDRHRHRRERLHRQQRDRRLGERRRLLRLAVRRGRRRAGQHVLAGRNVRRWADPGDRRDRVRAARRRRPHAVQPLLAADDDRGQLAPRAHRSRRRHRGGVVPMWPLLAAGHHGR